MCLAIPGKVQSISGVQANVDVGGVNRTISVLLTPDVQVGDYVYVHTGYAISVLDEAEAMESLKLLQELAETFPVDEMFYTTSDQPPQPGTSGV